MTIERIKTVSQIDLQHLTQDSLQDGEVRVGKMFYAVKGKTAYVDENSGLVYVKESDSDSYAVYQADTLLTFSDRLRIVHDYYPNSSSDKIEQAKFLWDAGNVSVDKLKDLYSRSIQDFKSIIASFSDDQLESLLLSPGGYVLISYVLEADLLTPEDAKKYYLIIAKDQNQTAVSKSMIADSLVELGYLNDALPIYQAIVEDPKTTYSDLSLIALSLDHYGMTDEAIKIYNKIGRDEAAQVTDRLQSARGLQKIQKLDDAKLIYQKILGNKHAPSWQRLEAAQELGKLEEKPQARITVDTGRDADEDPNPLLQFATDKTANIRDRLKAVESLNQKEAVEAYQFLGLDTSISGYSRLAAALHLKSFGETSAAKMICLSLTDQNEYQTQIVECLIDLGEVDRAKEFLLATIHNAETDPSERFFCAQKMEELKMPEASEAYRSTLSSAKVNPMNKWLAAEGLARMGFISEARDFFEKIANSQNKENYSRLLAANQIGLPQNLGGCDDVSESARLYKSIYDSATSSEKYWIERDWYALHSKDQNQ